MVEPNPCIDCQMFKWIAGEIRLLIILQISKDQGLPIAEAARRYLEYIDIINAMVFGVPGPQERKK